MRFTGKRSQLNHDLFATAHWKHALVWLHSRPWRTTLSIGWINSHPLLLAATAPLQNMFIQQQWRLLLDGDDSPMTSLERYVARPLFEHGQR